jgi:hypothetical protein
MRQSTSRGRILASLAVVLVLNLAVASFAAPLKDLAGWSGTRWGMSPAQIKKVHPEMTIGKTKYGGTAGRVPDMTIADATFEVDLEFAGIGDLRKPGSTEPEPPVSDWKLARVTLLGPPDAFYRVDQPLLAKYGQPTKVDDGLKVWVLPTTTIRLIKLDPHCLIFYDPTYKGDSL